MIRRPTEEAALGRIMMMRNLDRQASMYDQFLLILNACGWSQRELARIREVRPQAVQQVIRRCRKRME